MAEIVGGALGVIEIIELAEKFGWLDRIIALFSKPMNIVVLGATGAGKSNFLATIQGIDTDIFDAFSRTHVHELHELKISDLRFNFIDTPGHQADRDERIHAIREALKQDKIGIINVVAYGYHDYDVIEKPVFMDGEKIKEDFLVTHRNLELDLTKEWLPILGMHDTQDILITLISKADIWWEQRAQVIEYYKSGPYGGFIGANFHGKTTAIPYCSIIKRFLGAIPPSREFTEVEKIRLRQNFLRSILYAVDPTNKK